MPQPGKSGSNSEPALAYDQTFPGDTPGPRLRAAQCSPVVSVWPHPAQRPGRPIFAPWRMLFVTWRRRSPGCGPWTPALLRSWKRANPPPTRAKPLPNLANFTMALRVQDVGAWISQCRLDPLSCPLNELVAATFVPVLFTSQKNGVCGKTLGHGRSDHHMLNPIAALTRRLHHLQLVGASHPQLLIMRSGCPWSPVGNLWSNRSLSLTTILRCNVAVLIPSLKDFAATSNISARSTCAGGAMAMLCGDIDSNCICLIGR